MNKLLRAADGTSKHKQVKEVVPVFQGASQHDCMWENGGTLRISSPSAPNRPDWSA